MSRAGSLKVLCAKATATSSRVTCSLSISVSLCVSLSLIVLLAISQGVCFQGFTVITIIMRQAPTSVNDLQETVCVLVGWGRVRRGTIWTQLCSKNGGLAQCSLLALPVLADAHIWNVFLPQPWAGLLMPDLSCFYVTEDAACRGMTQELGRKKMPHFDICISLVFIYLFRHTVLHYRF